MIGAFFYLGSGNGGFFIPESARAHREPSRRRAAVRVRSAGPQLYRGRRPASSLREISSRVIIIPVFLPASAPPSGYSKCSCTGPANSASRTISKELPEVDHALAERLPCRLPLSLRIFLPRKSFTAIPADLPGDLEALDPSAQAAFDRRVPYVVIHSDQLRDRSHSEDLMQIPDRTRPPARRPNACDTWPKPGTSHSAPPSFATPQTFEAPRSASRSALHPPIQATPSIIA